MKKLIFTLSLLLLPLLASADPVEIDGIYYNLIRGEIAEVTKKPNNSNYSGSIVIPKLVVYEGKAYSVTSIGEWAFYDCSGLTAVTIPTSVTSIGSYAFNGCSGMISVTIPNSVISIGNGTFSRCIGLTSIIIPNSVTIIGEGAFSSCSGLTSVSIPNSVTSIGGNAFQNCSSLTSVTIPNSVTTISKYSFDGCSSLTSVTIPNSVTSIGYEAFNCCSSLTSVTIPNSVTTIGSEAFRNCQSLTSVTIPNSVTSIDKIAFSGCSSLTSVTIGSNVEIIGSEAFAKCKELKDVYCLAKNVPNTFTDAFMDSYPEYSTLHVPAKSINIYKNTAPWSGFGKIVSLDSGDTSDKEKCATPTISYQFGQLSFSCDTEDVTFVSEITDYDIKKSYDASLFLTATYYISVYATKDGYEDSDVATATLSWLDAELETYISGGVASVRAKPVLIQSVGSTLSISGVDEGTPISIYDISGKMVGSAKAASENTFISTSLNPGDVGLVKIGDKTIKIIMK